MGVIHKLKPAVKEFILKQKGIKPILSCRKLAQITEKKFQIKVSKSSINSLLKSAKLSMPVGRRRKHRRTSSAVEAEGLGVVLLQAADALAGGSYYFSERIQGIKNPEVSSQALSKIECLLYSPLFEANSILKADCGLWPLINQRYTEADMSSYLSNLQEVTTLQLDIFNLISQAWREARYIKVVLSDQSSLYLDGQLHTVWSTTHIPYDFSSTIYKIKSYMNAYFQESKPFIFFMAPGYDTPTKDFFSFILSLEAGEKRISKLVLYGNRAEELETILLERAKKYYFIFGLWPWQFKGYRKVNLIGEFQPFSFGPFQNNFYLADAEVEISQPIMNKNVTLRGCALKTSPNDKIRLIILSNLPFGQVNSQGIASAYLSRWPNLEECFQDFSRKIELFTYTASAHRFFSPEKLALPKDASSNIRSLFNYYLKGLDLYVKRHFLPAGCEDKSFQETKEQFYSLRAALKRKKGEILVIFKPPAAHPQLKELEYACCRINEREIILAGGSRLWCGLA